MTSKHPGWKIYRRQMGLLGHGDALWEPAPIHSYKRINLGDVGYIRRGRFHLLFSAGCPLGTRRLGIDVPPTFEPLDVGPAIFSQPRLPGHLCTDSVKTAGASLGTSINTTTFLEPGGKLTLELTEKQGAALVTKYRTYREDAELESGFEEYTKRHYDSWVAFARNARHGNNVKPVLVTGIDMTRDFAMIAYSNNNTHLASEFTTSVPLVASASASVWGTWCTQGLVHTNCGPQVCNPPSPSDASNLVSADPTQTDSTPNEYNQCVFIRYFTVRKRALMFPRVIKAGAGPHDLGPGKNYEEAFPEIPAYPTSDSDTESEYSDDSEMDDSSSVTSYESDFEVFHNVSSEEEDPFDTVAKYVFQNSEAEAALFHHRDIIQVREETQGTETTGLSFEHHPAIVVDSDGVGRLVQQVHQQPAEVPSRTIQAGSSEQSVKYLDRISVSSTSVDPTETLHQGIVHTGTQPLVFNFFVDPPSMPKENQPPEECEFGMFQPKPWRLRGVNTLPLGTRNITAPDNPTLGTRGRVFLASPASGEQDTLDPTTPVSGAREIVILTNREYGMRDAKTLDDLSSKAGNRKSKGTQTYQNLSPSHRLPRKRSPSNNVLRGLHFLSIYDPGFAGVLELFRSSLSSKDELWAILALAGEDARFFIQIIDKAPVTARLDRELQEIPTRVLIKLCGPTGYLQDFSLFRGKGIAVKPLRVSRIDGETKMVEKFCKGATLRRNSSHSNVLPLCETPVTPWDGGHTLASEGVSNSTTKEYVRPDNRTQFQLLADGVGGDNTSDAGPVHGNLKGISPSGSHEHPFRANTLGVNIPRANIPRANGNAHLADSGLMSITHDPGTEWLMSEVGSRTIPFISRGIVFPPKLGLSATVHSQWQEMGSSKYGVSGRSVPFMIPEFLVAPECGLEERTVTEEADIHAMAMVNTQSHSGTLSLGKQNGSELMFKIFGGARFTTPIGVPDLDPPTTSWSLTEDSWRDEREPWHWANGVPDYSTCGVLSPVRSTLTEHSRHAGQEVTDIFPTRCLANQEPGVSMPDSRPPEPINGSRDETSNSFCPRASIDMDSSRSSTPDPEASPTARGPPTGIKGAWIPSLQRCYWTAS